MLGNATVGRKEEASSAITPTVYDIPLHGLSTRYIIERLDQTIAKIRFTQVKSDCICSVRNKLCRNVTKVVKLSLSAL